MKTVKPAARRRLSLPARLAATAFAAARTRKPGGRARRRIRLRWRRPSARVEASHSPAAGARTPQAWHPRVHLHFGVVVSVQRRAAAMARGVDVVRDRQFSAGELRERLLGSTARIDRVWERMRIVGGHAPLATRRQHEAVRHGGIGGRSAHQAGSVAPGAARLAWRRAADSPGANSRPRLPAGNAMTAPSITALRGSAHGRLTGSRPPLRFRTKSPLSPAEPGATQPAPRPRRPVPLVWRNAGSEGARASSSSSSRPLEAVMPPPAPSQVQGVTPASAAVEPQLRRLPVRTTDFEPGVLDRLTDDVIRRVERRARIERERRGL